MGDHCALTERDWQTHDRNLEALLPLIKEADQSFKALRSNGRKIAENLRRVLEAIQGRADQAPIDQGFIAQAASRIARSARNPKMSKAAIKRHHDGVDAIIALVEDQIRASAQFNAREKKIHRHLLAIANLYRRR